MSDHLNQTIMAELKSVINPKTNIDIVNGKDIKSLNITEDKITVIVEIEPAEPSLMSPLQPKIENIIKIIDENLSNPLIYEQYNDDKLRKLQKQRKEAIEGLKKAEILWEKAINLI